MSSLLQEVELRLEELRLQDQYRQLTVASGLDFSSNDYLGLSQDPSFRAAILERVSRCTALTSPSSRLLAGNTPSHQELEERLSQLKGSEAALVFPSGYQANVGLLSTLIKPSDRVLSDKQNHASIIDGLRLSRCQKVIFPHLDTGAISEALSIPHPQGRTFLVTESLFSMDGDIAPLDVYARMAERGEAHLIVDDSHALGVFGKERGSGLTERFGIEGNAAAIVSTFGKALGLYGAFVAAPRPIIEYLVNTCRSFIFSTAVSPLMLSAIQAGLDILEREPQRRERVRSLANRLREQLRGHGLDTLNSGGPIVPVIVGRNQEAVAAARRLQDQGLDVRAIRPPAVAPGTSRLRISVHANHRDEDIDRLAAAVIEAVRPMLAKSE